jgi:four helix bundle protein
MFLHLNHQKLDVYSLSRALVKECYFFTKSLPSDERFAMSQQIRRAALSVHLNIAEGASRKSKVERRRYFEVARGSVVEIDAALDIAYDLGYLAQDRFEELGKSMVRCFSMLSKLINT